MSLPVFDENIFDNNIFDTVKFMYDSIGLLDQPYSHKFTSIADASYLDDSLLAHKSFSITDLLSLIDLGVTRPIRLMTLLDLIGLVGEVIGVPERDRCVNDLSTLIDYSDVWQGKWEAPIEFIYLNLRDKAMKIMIGATETVSVSSKVETVKTGETSQTLKIRIREVKLGEQQQDDY